MTPKPTQLKTIEQELLKGSVIDSVIAFEKYHITRLSSIIQRLRKKGLPIISTKKENSSLACYSLAETGKGESEYNYTFNNKIKNSVKFFCIIC